MGGRLIAGANSFATPRKMELSPRVFFRPEKPNPAIWTKGHVAESKRKKDLARLIRFLNQVLAEKKPGMDSVRLNENGILVHSNGKSLSRSTGEFMEQQISRWKARYGPSKGKR